MNDDELLTALCITGAKLWSANILNNYYTGRYYTYGAYGYHVVAESKDEVVSLILENADDIRDQLSMIRLSPSGKKILSKEHTLPITREHIGTIAPIDYVYVTSKRSLSAFGYIYVSVINQRIVGASYRPSVV